MDYVKKYSQQQLAIRENYSTFSVNYNGMDNNDFVSGQDFCCNENSPEAARAKMLKARAVSNNFHDTEEYERMQFYYHPDHLGSSSYITNLDGEVVQHIEYVPFGEVLIEERNNMWNTPYLFNSRASRTQYQTYLDIAETKPTIIFDNAKEYDEEIGMYYYGARYYEPRISLWMSTDNEGEKMSSVSSFAYCRNNTTSAIDPDGNKIVFVNGKIGGGSPPAGEQYWRGGYSSFVEGAKAYWNDTHVLFTKEDYSNFSSAESRISAGYRYAGQNINMLVSGLKDGETFKFVTHSMGAAQNVITVDYQNTDDWVINKIPFVRSPGDIKDADFHIRELLNDSDFRTRHRSPIDSQGKSFWEKLQKRTKGPIIDSPIRLPKLNKVNTPSNQKAQL